VNGKRREEPTFPDGQPDFRTWICLSVFAENMTSEEAASCSAIFGFIILASTSD
jgi:hypothetical protein